jgi:hypothetical protein
MASPFLGRAFARLSLRSFAFRLGAARVMERAWKAKRSLEGEARISPSERKAMEATPQAERWPKRTSRDMTRAAPSHAGRRETTPRVAINVGN